MATNIVASPPPNGDRLQRRPLVPKYLALVVDKEIKVNAWIDMKETDMNKDGQTFVCCIAVYSLEPFRSNSL